MQEYSVYSVKNYQINGFFLSTVYVHTSYVMIYVALEFLLTMEPYTCYKPEFTNMLYNINIITIPVTLNEFKLYTYKLFCHDLTQNYSDYCLL